MTWWNNLYDDLLAEMLLVRADPAETEATLAFLIRELRLSPGDRVFDQCSGIGSLAIPLAEQGFNVTAVEQCSPYVQRAMEESSRLSDPPQFETGDAFAFVCDPPVQGAFNWWTSFGYAEEDAANANMLARAFESLIPGGRFALDFMNFPAVLRTFQPDHHMTRTTPMGEVTLRRESTVDLGRGSLHKVWTYNLPDGQQVRHESRVRTYMPRDLADLAQSVGFMDPTFFGGVSGDSLSLDSGRCILVVRKPGVQP